LPVSVLAPVFLYLEFRRAYQESQVLLLSSVRAEGRTIGQSLLRLLETLDNAALPDLGRHLDPLASEVTKSGCSPNFRHRKPRVTAEQFHARLWPNNATRLTQNRLALVGKESVSVSHRRQRLPGQSGEPTHAHLHYWQ
jgi:hypothetical protein